MRPVSQAFLETLTGSHTMAVRLRAVPAGQTGVSPTSTVTLLAMDGDVQLDGTADIRATIDCTVAAEDPDTGLLLWPERDDSVLTPYGGHELFAERGIAYGGGAIEYVSLGYFRIDSVDQANAPDGPIALGGKDRMAHIVDSKITEMIQFASTDTYGDVVSQLVVDAYPDAVIEWDDDTEFDPIGRSILVDQGPRYPQIHEVITGVGKVMYFDHRGVLLIRNPPEIGRPLWTVSRGAEGVLVSASRSLSREGVYNGVLATGEAVDIEEPASALVVDDDPDSPTYWGGPFGKVSREFSSPLLTSAAQCALAGATVLRRSTGLPYNVDFSAIPNPALEPEDVLAIGIEGAPRVNEPELITGDSFTRTVVDGMGTSDTGHNYAGGGVTTQINGGVLKKEMVANDVDAITNGADIGQRNVRIYADVRVPAAATGATLVFGVIVRRSSSGDDYFSLRHEFTAAGTVHAVIARHSASLGYQELETLGSWAPYTAGQWWTMCAEADGDNLRFKAWPRDTGSEPDEWLLVSDRGSEIVTDHFRFGLYFWRLLGNTNAVVPQYEVDNYRVLSIPRETLSGGEIHVLDSVTIPLTAEQAMTGKTREQRLVSAEAIA